MTEKKNERVKMNIEVLDKTSGFIKQFAEQLVLSEGEIVDRSILRYSTKNPVSAAGIVLDNLVMCVHKMDDCNYEQTALIVLTFIKDSLKKGGIKALRETIDELEEHFKDEGLELDSKFNI